jgi:hypothetical protein
MGLLLSRPVRNVVWHLKSPIRIQSVFFFFVSRLGATTLNAAQQDSARARAQRSAFGGHILQQSSIFQRLLHFIFQRVSTPLYGKIPTRSAATSSVTLTFALLE